MNTITVIRTDGTSDVYLDDEGGLEHVCVGSGIDDIDALTDALNELTERRADVRRLLYTARSRLGTFGARIQTADIGPLPQRG